MAPFAGEVVIKLRREAWLFAAVGMHTAATHTRYPTERVCYLRSAIYLGSTVQCEIRMGYDSILLLYLTSSGVVPTVRCTRSVQDRCDVHPVPVIVVVCPAHERLGGSAEDFFVDSMDTQNTSKTRPCLSPCQNSRPHRYDGRGVTATEALKVGSFGL